MKKKKPLEAQLQESESTWIGENTELTGEFSFKGIVRVFGKIKGEIRCAPGSEFIVMPSGVVEGNIQGDRIIVAGYAGGDIHTTGKILIASSGRITGKLSTPTLQVDFGAIVECETTMPKRVS